MSPTVEAEDGGTEVFGHTVSDLQSDVSVSGKAITGDLKYATEGALPDHWGAGNFLVLKFANNDPSVTSIKVGLQPSASGMELQELDEDMNAAMKISDKDEQKLVVVSSSATKTMTEYYDLSGLELEES